VSTIPRMGDVPSRFNKADLGRQGSSATVFSGTKLERNEK
jgi:hypothetical protein